MKKRIPFQQVDVFTRVPFMGNPVAVVLDGAGLSTTQMQRSRTGRIFRDDLHHATRGQRRRYRLRIFTPRSELRSRDIPLLARHMRCCAADTFRNGPAS